MEPVEAGAICADAEHRPIVRIASVLCRSVKRAAGQHQSRRRIRAVVDTRETVNIREARAVGVHPEYRPDRTRAAILRRPIQNPVRHHQGRHRIGAVAVGAGVFVQDREILQHGEARAVRIETEHRSVAPAAAICRRAKKRAAGQQQSRLRIRPVAVRARGHVREREILEHRETRAIGLNPEHHARCAGSAIRRDAV